MNPNPRWLTQALMVLVLATAVQGCTAQTYEGPEQPRKDVAIVRPMNAFDHLGRESLFRGLLGPTMNVVIFAVDGKKMPGGDTQVSVLPGRHRITVAIVSCTTLCHTAPKVNLSLEAKAGRTYIVLGLYRDDVPGYWIEDDKSGEVVVGQKLG